MKKVSQITFLPLLRSEEGESITFLPLLRSEEGESITFLPLLSVCMRKVFITIIKMFCHCLL